MKDTFKMRRTLLQSGLALPLVAFCSEILAQEKFPSRPITLVLSAAPGGAGDYIVRLIGQKLTEYTGQAVIIENRPGAGMTMSAQYVRQAKPDGYTMLLTGNGMVLSSVLFNTLPYSLTKDFRPVSTLAFFDLAMIVDGQSKFTSVKELLAYGKANPGRLFIATTRIGSTQHLAAEMFKSMTGLSAEVIPYKSTADVMAALRTGDCQVGFDIVPPLLAQFSAKQLRPLAVTGSQRFPGLPDVPTVAESGVPGYEATSWNGVLVPVKTPDAIVRTLQQAIERAAAAPELRKTFQQQGYIVRSSKIGRAHV